MSDLDRKKALVKAGIEECKKHKFELNTQMNEIKTTIKECEFYINQTYSELMNDLVNVIRF